MLVVSSAQAKKGDKKDASVHVWDPESGVVVRAYRGGVCVPRGESRRATPSHTSH